MKSLLLSGRNVALNLFVLLLLFASTTHLRAVQALCDFDCITIGDRPMTKIAFTGTITTIGGNVFFTNSPATFDFRVGFTEADNPAIAITNGNSGAFYRIQADAPHLVSCYSYWGIRVNFADNFSPAGVMQVEYHVNNFSDRQLQSITLFVDGADASQQVTFSSPIVTQSLPANPTLPTADLLSSAKWGNLQVQMTWPSPGSFMVGIPNVNSAVFSTNPCPPLTLSSSRTNGQLQLAWPSAASSFTLYRNTNLITTNWSVVTNAPVAAGTNSMVVLPLTNSKDFFQLRRQSY